MKFSLFKKSSKKATAKKSAAPAKLTKEQKEAQEYEEYLRLKDKYADEIIDPEDEDFDVIYVDEDGNPIEVDEHGNPLVDVEILEEYELTDEELAKEEAAKKKAQRNAQPQTDADSFEDDEFEDDDEEFFEYEDGEAPAKKEVNPDDEEVILGMTKGDIKKTAQGSVYLAREGALAAQELKEAMDDIMGGLDVRNWIK